MEQTKPKPKAKRRLKSLDFSNADAAVALVGPSVGGPANGIPVLTFKSLDWSEDQVEKATKIRVTMEIEQFLQTFYGLYHDEAEVLARALGFDTAKEDMDESDVSSYEDYITSKVEAIEVLKSLYDAESIPDVLSTLTPDQYLSMLTDQAKLEKAFKKIEKEKNSAVAPVAAADEGSTEAVAKAEQSDEKTEAKVEPSETVNKGKSMTKEVKAEPQASVEMVEKSALESIQKQMEDQKVELQKALDLVKAFEAEKKEAVRKARFEQVKGAVKDEAKAEVLFKAVGLVEDESEFQAVVKALSELQALADKSDLFVEKGVQIETEEAPKESAVARVLKSRLAGK